jgi:SNF2 family DNA or RNA helicase
MSGPIDVKLTHSTSKGTLIRSKATIQYEKGRIWFLKSPFALKDEIKAMKGSKWHGNEEENPVKMWSIEDCQRNRFQLSWLMGEDVYAWFDRDLIRHEFERPILSHQCDLIDSGLTYHYQIWAAGMGSGKTLSAQEVIERSGVDVVYWCGPKTSLPNMRREFKKWGFPFHKINVEFMTYEALVRLADEGLSFVPQMLICDEASRCKGPQSQRTRAVQFCADKIREVHGLEKGFVIEMSGTPAPKSPVDWWSLCEIAWPGFLKEGSPKALEQRLAFLSKHEFDSGVFNKRVGWKDDERKCAVCAEYQLEGPHELDGLTDPKDYHKFEPSKNEVAYLYERLKGLVVVKHTHECRELPEARYRKIICKPSASTLRVAQALKEAAPNTITGLTWLRELSDGFQYREKKDGKIACPHCPEHKGKVDEWFLPGDEERVFAAIDMLNEELVAKLQKRDADCPRCAGKGEIDKIVRISKEVPCPKDKGLDMLLEECEETGRIVIFAGFTGSVDRIVKFCCKKGWDVVRCDGGNYQLLSHDGTTITTDGEASLDYWSDLNNGRVAFVSNPESGGMSLTLTESRMVLFYSNTFKPEYRSQAIARVVRPGDDPRAVWVVDLIHLPSDQRVIDVLQDNRRIELMSLGDFELEGAEVTDESELEIVEL